MMVFWLPGSRPVIGRRYGSWKRRQQRDDWIHVPSAVEQRLEVGEGRMRRDVAAAARIAPVARGFQLPLVLVVVAVHAQQFPVAAIRRIVIVIVIAVMDRQFAKVGAGKFAGAATTDPRIELERLSRSLVRASADARRASATMRSSLFGSIALMRSSRLSHPGSGSHPGGPRGQARHLWEPHDTGRMRLDSAAVKIVGSDT